MLGRPPPPPLGAGGRLADEPTEPVLPLMTPCAVQIDPPQAEGTVAVAGWDGTDKEELECPSFIPRVRFDLSTMYARSQDQIQCAGGEARVEVQLVFSRTAAR